MFNVNLKGIGEVAGSLGTLAKDIRSAVTGEISPEKKAELEAKALELEQASMNAQTEINKIEAGHTSLFVAGWRPAVGWICAAGLFYGTIGKPFIEFIARLCGFTGVFPEIDGTTLNTTLYGMLGLGVMRTVEKVKGSARNH
jgi:roadblock/LC7 domain-containing protein